jgi:hypothetical protein
MYGKWWWWIFALCNDELQMNIGDENGNVNYVVQFGDEY